MVWEVKLRDTHPSPAFRRDGIVFTKGNVILKELSDRALQRELSLPNTPLEAIKLEDKIAALEEEIGRYEEKLPGADKKTYLSPLRAIRTYCIQCCGGSQKGPGRCTSKTCPLFDFRLGKHPGRVGIGGKEIQKILRI